MRRSFIFNIGQRRRGKRAHVERDSVKQKRPNNYSTRDSIVVYSPCSDFGQTVNTLSHPRVTQGLIFGGKNVSDRARKPTI